MHFLDFFGIAILMFIGFVSGFHCAAEDVRKITHGEKKLDDFWREKGVRQ